MTGYEPTETPFSDDERWQAWLLGDAASRSVAGCARCSGRGTVRFGRRCRACQGWGTVAVQLDESGQWQRVAVSRSPRGR